MIDATTTIWAGPPPPAVSNASGITVGPLGRAIYFYWVVSHFPIGSVVSQFFPVRNAPSPLTATNYVFFSWEPQLGAIGYDVLRTTKPVLPITLSPVAVATGLIEAQYADQNNAPSDYDVAGLNYPAPVDGWARVNNRSYSKPVLQLFPSIQVSSIFFTDGTEQDTAPSGGATAVGPLNGLSGVVNIVPADPSVTVTTAGQNIVIGATSQIPLVPPLGPGGSWTTIQAALNAISAGGGGVPAGPNQAVQFNNNGVFAGSRNLLFDDVNDLLIVNANSANPSTAASDATIQTIAANGGVNRIEVDSYGGAFSVVDLRAAQGPGSGPAPLPINGLIGGVEWFGWGNTAFQICAGIYGWAADNITDAASPGFLTFQTTFPGTNGTNEVMRITADAKVGIATTTPQATLDVAGAVNVYTYLGVNQTVGLGSGRIVVSTTAHEDGLTVFNSLSNSGAYVSLLNDLNQYCFLACFGSGSSDGPASTGGLWSNLPITFGISSGFGEVMRITPSGRVGIGTWNPQATLDVLDTGSGGGSSALNVVAASGDYSAGFTGPVAIVVQRADPTLGAFNTLTIFDPNGSVLQFGKTIEFTSWIQSEGVSSVFPANLLLNPLGGNVLINTQVDSAGPGWNLQVNGGTLAGGPLLVALPPQAPALTYNNNMFTIYENVNQTVLMFGKTQAYAWMQSSFNTSPTGTPLLLNPLGGNVGINTQTPAVALDTGPASATIKVATWSNGSTYASGIGVSSAGLTFAAAVTTSGGSEQMILTNAGFLGIGTSAASYPPNAPLTIAGYATPTTPLINIVPYGQRNPYIQITGVTYYPNGVQFWGGDLGGVNPSYQGEVGMDGYGDIQVCAQQYVCLVVGSTAPGGAGGTGSGTGSVIVNVASNGVVIGTPVPNPYPRTTLDVYGGINAESGIISATDSANKSLSMRYYTPTNGGIIQTFDNSISNWTRLDINGSPLNLNGGLAGNNPVNLTLGPGGTIAAPALPNADPGAGTKQFWYDPADGNRVKYSP